MSQATARQPQQCVPRPEGNSFLEWSVPGELTDAPAVAYRNSFARALATLPPEQIVASYVYLSASQMRSLVNVAIRSLGANLRGTGLEVGSGCGLLASTVAALPGVERVYAVEVCRELLRLVMPKISRAVLGEQSQKVIGVHGSFNDLELPDGSMDFIVEIDSLHHSDDLSVTLRECGRVLREGGQMLLLDRCHPDSVTDADVDEMLSQVYSEAFLRKNHYPPGVVLTRRDNGEHEYRLFEWLEAFRAGGLKVVKARKLVYGVRPALALKGLLNLAPRRWTERFYRTENANLRTTLTWLKQRLPMDANDPFFGRPVLAPKSTTAFLLTRKS